MATSSKKTKFFDSVEGEEVKQMLKDMVKDKGYNTDSSYSANSDLYPDSQIPFVDKHVNYINNHPSLDPHHYLANLRLMTRVR